MFRFRSSFIAAALFTLGAALSPGTLPASAQASADPITITGNGQKQSAPFALAGGTYRVDWSLSNPTSRLAWMTLESTTEVSVPQSEFVHTMEKDPSGQTFLYKLKPGTYYLRAFAPAAWSVTFTPDPPIETAKPIAATTGDPLALAPFAGGWGKHGYSLTINPDGSGEAIWRVYDRCGAPGVTLPCDRIDETHFDAGGHAVLLFSSVERQTAYGSLVDISDPAHPIFRSTSLTLRPDGTARLRTGSEAEVRTPVLDVPDGSPRYGMTLCRPESWQTEWCGA